MWHFLPLVAFTHACVSCYGKITTKHEMVNDQQQFLFHLKRSTDASLRVFYEIFFKHQRPFSAYYI